MNLHAKFDQSAFLDVAQVITKRMLAIVWIFDGFLQKDAFGVYKKACGICV